MSSALLKLFLVLRRFSQFSFSANFHVGFSATNFFTVLAVRTANLARWRLSSSVTWLFPTLPKTMPSLALTRLWLLLAWRQFFQLDGDLLCLGEDFSQLGGGFSQSQQRLSQLSSYLGFSDSAATFPSPILVVNCLMSSMTSFISHVPTFSASMLAFTQLIFLVLTAATFYGSATTSSSLGVQLNLGGNFSSLAWDFLTPSCRPILNSSETSFKFCDHFFWLGGDLVQFSAIFDFGYFASSWR